MEGPLTFSSGWHDLEIHGEVSLRWSKAVAQLLLAPTVARDYSFLELTLFSLDLTDRLLSVDVLDHQGKEITTFTQPLKDFASAPVRIPISGARIVRFFVSTFCPRDFGSLTDTRDLGIAVNQFHLISGTNPFVMSVTYKAKDLKIIELTAAKAVTEEGVGLYDFISFREPFTKPTFGLDDITVLITCHGDRVELGERAFKSVMATGIKKVVLAISGNDPAYEAWGTALSKANSNVFALIIKDNTLNNNQCWEQGVACVKTPYTVILHDDDYLLPAFGKELRYFPRDTDFALWNGRVYNPKEDRVELDGTIDLPFKTRRYVPNNLIRDLLIRYNYSISPVHGCFRTEKLKLCLNDWEEKHHNDPVVYERPTFVVGNDLYIWEYFTRDTSALCFYTPARCVHCVTHKGSATYINVYRFYHDKKADIFADMYRHVKDIHISKRLKHGIIFYVNEENKAINRCLKNLGSYKRSHYTGAEMVVYSENRLKLPNAIQIAPLPTTLGVVYRPSDYYSFWAFIEGIRIAKEKGWDYFFCYEWDCMVGRDYWYDTLWDEHLAWQYEPIITGTPTLRLPIVAGGETLYSAQHYLYKYAEASGVAMRVEPSSPTALYTNGALTFYHTDSLLDLFAEELSGTIPLANCGKHVDLVAPWDIGLGIKLYKRFGNEVFKKVGWLPSIYSGCGDKAYSQEQRLNMLLSGKKVAIHQYKYEN